MLVRHAAERHQLLDAHRKRDDRLAGHDRHASAPSAAARISRERHAADQHLPGAADASPVMQRSRVDLPAPFGPISATSSPGGDVRLTSRSTGALP